ncbi:serine/arginine repetitive matrix protein 2-like isoform X2 [Penaeus japonicus]|uniref:serine/arginine repetitive matrix protein 2-like isoform X2 n=1 Tax=Penaeus japonicus TaxID=27405 RepID=UPI001C70E5DB|nr:serine/arginine repetitive matrix protein 2-like isoform X2 [Penaeus japonicus]
MVIEYKERGSASWTLVSNHVRWDNETEYVVLDLNPAHRYTLRVTAHNSAGSSVATYPFTTLTPLGATLSPEVIVHGAVGTAPWYLDSHILMAVIVACILVLLAACIAIAYTCRRTRTHTQTYKEVGHIHNDLTPDSGLTSDTMTRVHSLEILEAYTPSTLPLGAYDEISPYATFRMPGDSKTPPPPPLPSPVVSTVETNYSRVKRKCPAPPEGGLPPTPGNASSDVTYEKNSKSKTASKCPSIKEKATTKEASGSSVTSVSSNHEELVRAYHAHANDTPTTPESGRRNKCDGDYQTVADMVGGRSRTESTTSHEESSDEARGARSHRRSRGQEPPPKQGHRPSRGDPDYSYARPVKKPGPPPPPLSSTESNSAEYGDGWAGMDSEGSYSRRHTLEFSEAECDHPSIKKDIEPLEQLIVDLEKEKILFDPNKTPKAYAAAL